MKCDLKISNIILIKNSSWGHMALICNPRFNPRLIAMRNEELSALLMLVAQKIVGGGD
jgi:hypothetical protein